MKYFHEILTEKVQVFSNEEKERQRIVEMRQCDAERLGIARVTRLRLREKKTKEFRTNH